MLIGITMQEIKQLVECLITGHTQTLHQPITCHAINGKHVDIDTSYIVAMFALDKCGAAINYLSKTSRIVVVSLNAQGFQRLWQPLVSMHHKTIIIRTRHTDIHIIVPRDEAFMTNSTQHGTCPTIVPDVMLLTDMVYRQEYLQNVLM